MTAGRPGGRVPSRAGSAGGRGRAPRGARGGGVTAAAAVTPGATGGTARALALQALLAADSTGAGRANVVVPELLGGSDLSSRDRAFVTELVYGTVRMQRACDWLIQPHLRRPVDRPVRAALRLGAYQLAFLRTPPHAAVSATVAEVGGPAHGLVNAVLRRVAHHVGAGLTWPSDAVRLSYPDWIVARLSEDLGPDVALDVLEEMNHPARMTARDDGYVQDLASQWAGAAVGGAAGERIIDLCAAPGGKATYMASRRSGPALVIAGDVDPTRARVIRENSARLAIDNLATVAADGTRPPFRPGTFDRVLVDAPCSGLGVLRRRPDARWRIQPADIDRLAGLQRRLLSTALTMAKPGGLVVYSVCTLTATETVDMDRWLASTHPEAEAVAVDLDPAWQPAGRGARLLPPAAGTDGMFLLAVRTGAPGSVSGSGSVDSQDHA